MAGPKKPSTDKEFAGEQRKQYIDGLKVELEGYKRSGNDARAADVEAELKRVTSTPRNATPAGTPTGTTVDSTPTTQR